MDTAAGAVVPDATYDGLQEGLRFMMAHAYPSVSEAVVSYVTARVVAVEPLLAQGTRPASLGVTQEALLSTSVSGGGSLGDALAAVAPEWFASGGLVALIGGAVDAALAYHKERIFAGRREAASGVWFTSSSLHAARVRIVDVCMTRWFRTALLWFPSMYRTEVQVHRMSADRRLADRVTATIAERLQQMAAADAGARTAWLYGGWRNLLPEDVQKTGSSMISDLRSLSPPVWWEAFRATLKYQHMGATAGAVETYIRERYVRRNQRLRERDLIPIAAYFGNTQLPDLPYLLMDKLFQTEPYLTAEIGFVEAVHGYWAAAKPVPTGTTPTGSNRDWRTRRRQAASFADTHSDDSYSREMTFAGFDA